MYVWADQILCAKNETRRQINQLVRKYLYNIDDDTSPIEGDKIICLKNDWENANETGDVMVNGTLGVIKNIKYSKENPFVEKTLIADFLPEERIAEAETAPLDVHFRNLNMDYKLLTTGEPTVNKTNFNRIPKPFKPKEFDYGYCITVHKAQGSEYNKVLVFEEFLKGGDHARWLYTAATRAKEKLVIVRNYR